VTTLWFTSDLHIGHRLVSGLRGFSDTAEHDAHLAEQWDSRVQNKDTVWILGDVTVGRSRPALDWIHARPGTKHLVTGNHDEVWPGHREAFKVLSNYGSGWSAAFASIQPFARRRIAGQNVLMSHFPYPGTSEGTDANGRPFDDRYIQYRLQDLGVPLLHGHTHRNERATRSQLGTLQIHVGVDAWGMRPVRQDEIEDLLD
jgi:calcineurin-like phosphoesterase family protein